MRELLELGPQSVEVPEGVGEFLVDLVGISSHYFHPSLHVDQLRDAAGADSGVLLCVGTYDAGDVVAPGLRELEGNADGRGGDVEGWYEVIGRELSEVLPDSVLIRVDGDGLIADLLLAEVHLQVVDLVLPLQDPLYAVQMRPQLVLYAVEGSGLKLDLWFSEALEAAVSLEQVGLEVAPEVDHIGA